MESETQPAYCPVAVAKPTFMVGRAVKCGGLDKLAASRTAAASSVTRRSMTPFFVWTSAGPISSGLNEPSPPPSIIAGPPIPMLESSLAITTSQQPSSAALPAKQ